MTYRTIDDIFEMLEKTHTKFLSSVEGLTEEDENFRPAPDRWTIAENAEHVSIVYSGGVRLTYKLLKRGEAAPRPAPADLKLSSLVFNDDGQMKPGKLAAPEVVRPQGGVSVAAALARNREAIDQIVSLKSRLEAVDLSDQTWDHPFFGPLSLYQWILLMGEHEERHRLQIEQIKAQIKGNG